MKKLEKFTRVVIYIAFLILLTAAFNKKFNVNVDEVYSYGLANHYGTGRLSYEDGVKYTPANAPWMEYVTAAPDHRFDYRNVWKNQAEDVHPPFYYVILHTICSFFPGQFSIWYGGVINIFFCVASLIVFGKIVRIYTDDFRLEAVLMAAYAACPAFPNMVMFIRMYTMAAFCVMLFTYYYIRYLRGEKGRAILLKLTAAAVFGALTHYYCMIFVVLLSFGFGFYSLISRRFADLIKYSISMAAAAGLSVAIFPGIIGHFFNSKRGKQTLSNAGSDDVLRTNLIKDVDIITKQMFGNRMLIGIIALIVVILLVAGIIKGSGKFNTELLLICLAVVCYTLMISATAPYATDRYFFPIYGILFTLASVWLTVAVKGLFNKNIAIISVAIACLAISVVSWKGMEWGYIDDFTKESIEWAKAHSDLDVIMIHGARYRMHTSFFEISEYASSTLVNLKDLSNLPEPKEYEGKDFVLMVAAKEDDEEFLTEVMNRYPGHTYSKVAYSGYHSSYYFTCNQ